jgi:DnaJ-class molecular chaperone
MRKEFYHVAFEFSEEFEALGEKGLIVDTVRAVCPTCNGYGSHFRSDLDENEMIDMFEQDGDYDSYISYKKGAFDQRCTQCNGQKVIDEPINLPEWATECIRSYYQGIEDDRKIRFAENGYRY